jgi:DNA-binding MarR family transcriptional regulator
MSRSDHAELAARLEHLVRQFIAYAILFNQKVADDAGINLRDMQVLHLLQLHGPSTPRDLALRASVTTGGMTVILDRLEKGGYARRAANPADRRSCIVHLIPQSLRKLEGVYASKSRTLSRAIRRYGESELRLLVGFFERISGEEPGE